MTGTRNAYTKISADWKGFAASTALSLVSSWSVSYTHLSKTLHAEELDKSTALDTIYYSSKVPFGFNYADGEANFGSDDDTMMGHGTHVAGIIAGNLTEAAQEQFDMTSLGIAPEAQLVIMKVFDQGGNCYFDYLIAAIEDAIALGVDCAKMCIRDSLICASTLS